MQENDQSRRAGRPSLLSEQAPTSDNDSILSKLDGGAGAIRPAKASGGVGRVAGIAAAVALTGGALGWVMSNADAPAPAPLPVAAVVPPPQAAVVPAPAPVAPVPPSAAQVVPVATPVPGTGSDVSAATILDEVPSKHESGAKSLAASLEAPSPKPASAPKDELVALLDKPQAPADKADKPAPRVAETKHETKDETKHEAKRKAEPAKLAKADKPTRKEKAAKEKAARDKAAKEKRLAAAQKSKPAVKKEKAALDSDAALLAALLAHTKKTPARTKTSEYQKCSTLDSVAAADKCRERLCASGAKAPAECKPPVAKASS